MYTDLKKKWVTALRSGNYRQTQNVMKRGDSFCCLGVLRDVQSKENPDVRWNYCFDDCKLSNNEMADLVSLNDSERRTFPEIADYIEKEIPNDERP